MPSRTATLRPRSASLKPVPNTPPSPFEGARGSFVRLPWTIDPGVRSIIIPTMYEGVTMRLSSLFTGLRRQKPRRPEISPIHNDLVAAETRLRKLKHDFQRISRRWDRPAELRKFYRTVTIAAIAATAGFALTWYFLTSPWSLVPTLKHLAAFPNCDAARLVGLAPAYKGQPGYWAHNDRDGDGIACERYRPPSRH
jgi:Excalibur calcium-binding domain